MNPSILIAISQWAGKNFQLGESLKEVGTEVLQKCLWNPLKNKIIKYFNSDREANEFIEQISITEASNIKKPERDVEDLYEELKGEIPTIDLFNAIVAFFNENQELIKRTNLNNGIVNNDNIAYYQTAENIYNNKGIQNITIYPKEGK